MSVKSKRHKKHIPGSRIRRWFGKEVFVFWRPDSEKENGRALLLDIGYGCVMLARTGGGGFGMPEVCPLTDVKYMELVEDKP